MTELNNTQGLASRGDNGLKKDEVKTNQSVLLGDGKNEIESLYRLKFDGKTALAIQVLYAAFRLQVPEYILKVVRLTLKEICDELTDQGIYHAFFRPVGNYTNDFFQVHIVSAPKLCLLDQAEFRVY